MKSKNPSSFNRVGCTVQVLKYFIVPALLIYLFRYELGLIKRSFQLLVLGNNDISLPPVREWISQVIYFGGGVLIAVTAAAILIYLFSSRIFPTKFSRDQNEVLKRLVQFLFQIKAPVIWIRDGKQQIGPVGVTDFGGGVALVDPSSAILLDDARKGTGRVRSAGVVFIGSGEKLAGAVSLRRQSRFIPNIKVQTSDGIELSTSVSLTFTLGEPPEVVKVAYIDRLPKNSPQKYLDLRVIKIKMGSSNSGTIEKISDELSPDDQKEIHNFVTTYQRQGATRTVALAPDDVKLSYPPYSIDEDRIKEAAQYKVRRANNEGSDAWFDVPGSLALEKVRNLISAYRYDELYLAREFDVFKPITNEPGDYPLVKYIRPYFACEMKYLGVISYQYIFPILGQKVEENLRVDKGTFRFAPVRPFSSPRILRAIGIKINSAGIGDIVPGPEISEERLRHWIASWQEVTQHQSTRALARAERIKAEARSRRYFEMLGRMYDILDTKNKSSGDVLIESILETLKEIAKDKDTRRGLPDETILLMKALQDRFPPAKS